MHTQRAWLNMEQTLPRVFAYTMIVALAVAATVPASAQQKVDRKGAASKVMLEQVISSHLAPLNGKYKLQATETTYEPGGYTGQHDHVGPGIRYVLSGEISFVQEGKETIYKAGQYFYEAGNISNSVSNKASSPVRILIFEILPADLKGGSAVPPKK
jgi:quercetin dioxygenase-like cupin family protein